jgi:hypothetical protein
VGSDSHHIPRDHSCLLLFNNIPANHPVYVCQQLVDRAERSPSQLKFYLYLVDFYRVEIQQPATAEFGQGLFFCIFNDDRSQSLINLIKLPINQFRMVSIRLSDTATALRRELFRSEMVWENRGKFIFLIPEYKYNFSLKLRKSMIYTLSFFSLLNT